MNPATDSELPPRRRAWSIKGFCEAYDVSRSLTYELLAANKLKAVNMGAKTLITADSAEQWFASLPAFKSGQKAA